MGTNESLDKFLKMVADDLSEVSKKVSDRVEDVREDVSGKGDGVSPLASVIKVVTDMASDRIAKDAYATFSKRDGEWRNFVDEEDGNDEVPTKSGNVVHDEFLNFFNRGVGVNGTLTQDELDELLDTTKDDEFGGFVSGSWFDELLKDEMSKANRVHRIGDEGIRVLKTETIVVDTSVMGLIGGISSWKLLDGNLHIEFLIGGVVLLDMSGVDLSSLEIDVTADKVFVRYVIGDK